LNGPAVIEAIAGTTSTQAVSSAVARTRLQEFLVSFSMYASLVILVAVLMVVSLALKSQLCLGSLSAILDR
jgi:FtsH-binding integral membrane protein